MAPGSEGRGYAASEADTRSGRRIMPFAEGDGDGDGVTQQKPGTIPAGFYQDLILARSVIQAAGWQQTHTTHKKGGRVSSSRFGSAALSKFSIRMR